MDNLKAVYFVLMYDGAENSDLLLSCSIAIADGGGRGAAACGVGLSSC